MCTGHGREVERPRTVNSSDPIVEAPLKLPTMNL